MDKFEPKILFSNELKVLPVFQPQTILYGTSSLTSQPMIEFCIDKENFSKQFEYQIKENIPLELFWEVEDLIKSCWIICDGFYIVLSSLPNELFVRNQYPLIKVNNFHNKFIATLE